jgi:hypothetical protein
LVGPLSYAGFIEPVRVRKFLAQPNDLGHEISEINSVERLVDRVEVVQR